MGLLGGGVCARWKGWVDGMGAFRHSPEALLPRQVHLRQGGPPHREAVRLKDDVLKPSVMRWVIGGYGVW